MYDPEQEYQNMLVNLKLICKQKNVSQYALAKATGMSTSSICSLMKGETRPYIYTVLMICQALDISIHQLFTGLKPAVDLEEEDMLRLYRRLPQEKQKQLRKYGEMLYQYKGEV